MNITAYQAFWITLGLIAQGLFAARMLVQWYASERAGQSVIPKTFWIMSFIGGVLMVAYACCWLKDPVIIIGQIAGLWIYARNLALCKPSSTEKCANA